MQQFKVRYTIHSGKIYADPVMADTKESARQKFISDIPAECKNNITVLSVTEE